MTPTYQATSAESQKSENTVPFIRPSDAEWYQNVQDTMAKSWERAERAGTLETIEEVEAQHAEFLRMDRATMTDVDVKKWWSDHGGAIL